MCQQQQWLPASMEQNLLIVVTTEPENRLGKENIGRTFPYNQIRLRYTTRTEFNQMLEQYFPSAR